MPTNNREEFRDYILRRMGWPLQQINIDDDQIEDRIDDALSFYHDYHYDGFERVLLKHTVTPEDIANGWIEYDEEVVNISKVVSSGFGSSGWMTPQYQITLDAVMSLNGAGSIQPYYMAMANIAELQFMFDQTPGIKFNRHKNRLYLNNWRLIEPGANLVVEAFRYIDPAVYTDVWNDRWLKQYAFAIMKRQWGENIKVFGGISLLGGVILDGQTIYNEGAEEVEKLESEMINSYSYPIMDEIG